MTYLNDVHGIIIGGFQSFVGDECVHDYNGNLIQIIDTPPGPGAREHLVNITRAHGAHKVASFLREYGADVEVIDYAFAWELEEWKDLWKSRYNSKTLFLCISTTFRQSSLYLWQFTEWVRENYPHIHIIGGTQSIDKILPYKLDWYVFGYGEYAMLELVKNLRDDTPGKMKYYQVGGKKIINAQEHYKAFPKKSMKISYEDRDFIKAFEILPMEWSRGCVFRCAFCTYPILGVRDDHSRDENDLYKEMMENYERWGTKHYALSDETVNDYHEKLERYAKVIKKLPFKPRFGGYARGDILVGRKKSWDTYIELGFMNQFYGVESLHHPSAKAVGKGMDSGRLKDGLLEFKEYAYKNHDFYAGHISLIAGLPNETLETLDEGKKWIRENWSDNFCAIGTLSINLPIYQGKYGWIAEKLATLSLIDKDPESYGYKILGEMRKQGLWQLDKIDEETFNNAGLQYGVPEDKKDETPRRVQVKWENNMGLNIKDTSEWLRTNGSILASGTFPTWSIAEYLIDPNLNYVDMMLKNDKANRLRTISSSHYLEDETPAWARAPNSEIPPGGGYVNKNRELSKDEYWDPASGTYVNKKDDVATTVNQSIAHQSDLEGTQFTSAGFNIFYDHKKLKLNYIRDYKRNKLNA
tara:strand:+ start:5462 stop:7381 length:1920 start_codon:yes stop_codon:yes gene_type:complete